MRKYSYSTLVGVSKFFVSTGSPFFVHAVVKYCRFFLQHRLILVLLNSFRLHGAYDGGFRAKLLTLAGDTDDNYFGSALLTNLMSYHKSTSKIVLAQMRWQTNRKTQTAHLSPLPVSVFLQPPPLSLTWAGTRPSMARKRGRAHDFQVLLALFRKMSFFWSTYLNTFYKIAKSSTIFVY